MYRLENPLGLLLFLLYPLLIAFYVMRLTRGSGGEMRFPSIDTLLSVRNTAGIVLRHSLSVLRLLALAMLIIAFARPQGPKRVGESSVDGVNIMLVLDVSPTMNGTDFSPNRIEAAKRVIASFVSERPNDNIGLVAFSTEAHVKCPLTLDHPILNNLLTQIYAARTGSTSIGLGIAVGVGALKNLKAKSSVIVLLTDGDNNSGEIDPLTAAEIANTFDIRIHTIGVGKPGTEIVAIGGMQMQITLDEEVLKKIASMTGGEYFNARNNEMLSRVYKRIDELEKTKIKERRRTDYRELYGIFIVLALIFLGLEILLASTRFRKIP
ncbi:MAG: VWA domain-containing protein [Spirochaetota bacterium]